LLRNQTPSEGDDDVEQDAGRAIAAFRALCRPDADEQRGHRGHAAELRAAQVALLANYLAEQNELAKLQASQGMEMWRLFLNGVRETREAPAEEQVERMQDEVERAAEALMQARDEALRVAALNATGLMQDASESALAAVRQPAWNGPERRTALATAYAGVERRRAA
jgi:hypothetical protein